METAVQRHNGTALDIFQAQQVHLEHLLPADVTLEIFRASTLLYLDSIRQVEQKSLLECITRAASNGLMPGIECYFLPFKGKATYVEDYRGIIKKLDRTGRVKKAFAHPVCQNDTFECDYLEDIFSHKPAFGQRGKVLFYYGAVIMKDGTRHMHVCELDYIEQVRRAAPGGEQDAWIKWYDAMARKTALKRCTNYVQLTTEYTQADQKEQSALTYAPIAEETAQQHIADLYGDDVRTTAHEPQDEAIEPQDEAIEPQGEASPASEEFFDEVRIAQLRTMSSPNLRVQLNEQLYYLAQTPETQEGINKAKFHASKLFREDTPAAALQSSIDGLVAYLGQEAAP